ncbi:hypothetical protein ZOD2009_15726 [Haladaptatus paucihalophilus DX253]|uniref:DUF8156 domain-containing protein n=2 Tax=Haladaptataceae TaxID=3064797 RepID=E7QWF7_HALPU|nr:hypothetical protein ZOD2009_15726 [Haladaptatus paucihalophilus DX253]SHL38635.1 hypothetical protein SAMN05444342_3737 [Haladaptatus paucihalophilus DX253]
MENRWGEYRRGLRRADQQVFDRLFEFARAHADASGLQTPRLVEIPALVSIILEQQKQIDDLEDRLDHLEQDLNDRE